MADGRSVVLITRARGSASESVGPGHVSQIRVSILLLFKADLKVFL